MGEKIQLLSLHDKRALYRSFLKAFSTYNVNLQMPLEAFEKRIFQKLNVREDCSAVSKIHDEITGFLLHTINDYRGLKTAYNGGTGVIPESRGRGLTSRLYEFLYPYFRELQVKRIILEVLTDNKAAIRTYEKIGFRYSQTFNCFIQVRDLVPRYDRHIRVKESNLLKPEYRQFADMEPAFLDQLQQLRYNLQNEKIMEVYLDEQLAGFIIFQPYLGRISQIAVCKKNRRRGIGSRLLWEAQQYSYPHKLTVMNVADDQEEMIGFLKKKGFFNEIDQYEMSHDL